MNKMFFILGASLMMLSSCTVQQTIPMNYSASLVNSYDRQLLFLVNEEIHHSRGDVLASYDGDRMLNNIGQQIATVNGGEIYNQIGQKIGEVEGGELLNVNGRKILTVQGGTTEQQAKVAAGYFCLLQP